MTTPKEMRAKRANLIAQARSKFDEITAETPEARAKEIETEFEKIMGEAEALEARAVQAERLEAAEAGLVSGNPRAPRGENGEARAAGAGRAAPTYRDAFHAMLRSGGQVYDLAPEMRAALESRAQVAGTDAAGGYLVPDEAMAPLVKAMAAWGPMFSDDFATVIKTTGGGTMPIPGVDDTAGRAAKNTAEGAALTDDGGKDAVFTKATLGDYLYDTEFLRLSVQLLSGAFEDVEGIFGGLLGERLGRTANEALTIGTGTNEPLGIVTGATASGVTIASNAAVTADEILNFLHSVDPAYRASPGFGVMFNDSTLLALHKLKDGQGNYLISGGVEDNTIRIGALKARYTVNQAMANIGSSARSMVAGDFKKYFVRKVGGVVVATMGGKEFFPGLGIAGYARFDGAVADAKAIKALVHPV